MTSTRPFGPAVAPKQHPKKGHPAPVVGNGQRVMLRVHADIHVALKGQKSTFKVTTVSVNSHGALVLMERSLPPETRLVLEHGQTGERVACRVGSGAREMPEGYHVPIEFDSPAPDFWKIAFPPSDWRPTD